MCWSHGLFCCSILWDVIVGVALLLWGWWFLQYILAAWQGWYLHWAHMLFPTVKSSFEEASRISRRWQWKDTHDGSARNWPGTAELSDCSHTNETSESFYLFVFILTVSSPGITVIFFRMSLPCVLQSIGFCGNTWLRTVRAPCADIVYKMVICVEWTCFYLLAGACCLAAWVFAVC